MFVAPSSKITEMLDWCNEKFGPRHRKRWGHSSLNKFPKNWPAKPPIDIYINNKEDAMAFKLRWI